VSAVANEAVTCVYCQLGSKARSVELNCTDNDQSMLLDFESPSSLIALTDLKVCLTHFVYCLHLHFHFSLCRVTPH